MIKSYRALDTLEITTSGGFRVEPGANKPYDWDQEPAEDSPYIWTIKELLELQADSYQQPFEYELRPSASEKIQKLGSRALGAYWTVANAAYEPIEQVADRIHARFQQERLFFTDPNELTLQEAREAGEKGISTVIKMNWKIK